MIEFHQVTAFQQQTKVLDKLSLKIESTEHVAILGPNGAGKSTLLKLINRELYPVVQAGSYIKLFGDETIHLTQLRDRIGFVSQDLQEYYTPYTSALEVVISGFFGAIGNHDHLQPNDQQIEQARQMLARLQISHHESSMFQRLSTGQKRRILLARAMVHDPQAFIFDEPANGLDMGGASAMLGLLRNFCSDGRAFIMTTHHVDEIIPEIDRVVLINKGRVIADDRKSKILTSVNLSSLYQTSLQVIEKDGWYRCWNH